LNRAFLSDDISVNNARPTNEQLASFFSPNSMVTSSTPATYSQNFRSMIISAIQGVACSIEVVMGYELLSASEAEELTESTIDSCRNNDNSQGCTYSQVEMSYLNRVFKTMIISSRFTGTTNMVFRAVFKISSFPDRKYFVTFIRHEDGTYTCALAKRLDGNRFVYIYNENELNINILTDQSHNPFN
jgi:hypothetical protein